MSSSAQLSGGRGRSVAHHQNPPTATQEGHASHYFMRKGTKQSFENEARKVAGGPHQEGNEGGQQAFFLLLTMVCILLLLPKALLALGWLLELRPHDTIR